MKKDSLHTIFVFVKKVIIYTIPIILVFIFLFFVYVMSREYYSVSKVIEVQQKNQSILFGSLYFNNPDVPYKLLLIKTVNPNIIVMGSSLGLQIRKEFFIKSDTFVNASAPIVTLGNIRYIKKFIQTIPNDGKERVIVLTLDKDLFTKDGELYNSNQIDSSFLNLFIYQVNH